MALRLTLTPMYCTFLVCMATSSLVLSRDEGYLRPEISDSAPSGAPTGGPGSYPSNVPTARTSILMEFDMPTGTPSSFPSTSSTTETPTSLHSISSNEWPTSMPSALPSEAPSGIPTERVSTGTPTSEPTSTEAPTATPSVRPSLSPSANPSPTPTVSPSTSPSTATPSCVPTPFPTPVFTTTLMINVFQTLDNCSAAEYKNTKEQSNAALAAAVVGAVDIFPDASVSVLMPIVDAAIIAADSVSRAALSRKGVTLHYVYSVLIEPAGFRSGKDAFDYFENVLIKSVASGSFTQSLQRAAAELKSPGLVYASASASALNIHSDFLTVNDSPKPSTAPTIREQSSSQGNSLNVIGPAVAMVVLAIASILVYFRFIRNSGFDDSFIPLSSQDSEGYDEIALMEKKAQMVSLSNQRSRSPSRVIRNKTGASSNRSEYSKIMLDGSDHDDGGSDASRF